MRIFALELNNDIKGIEQRKAYIEALIKQLPKPDLVVLPELALCSYMASQNIWQYADDCGANTSAWSVAMAKKYRTYIGTGYLDKENGDYFNRYILRQIKSRYRLGTRRQTQTCTYHFQQQR